MEVSYLGIKTNAKGLILVAALTALAYVINIFGVPIGPNVTWQFGDIAIVLVAALMGPLWAGIASVGAWFYVVVILWGSPSNLAVGFIHQVIMALLCKKVRPELSIPLSSIIMLPAYWINGVYIVGLPWIMNVQIAIKSPINAVVSGFILMLILRVPAVMQALAQYAPRSYKSQFTTELDELLETEVRSISDN